MVPVINTPRRQATLQQMHAPQIFLGAGLLLPLERREGLRHKEGRREVDGQPPFFVCRVLPPTVDDFVDKLGNRRHVLIRLRRKSQHKIELHAVPAAGKRRGTGL